MLVVDSLLRFAFHITDFVFEPCYFNFQFLNNGFLAVVFCFKFLIEHYNLVFFLDQLKRTISFTDLFNDLSQSLSMLVCYFCSFFFKIQQLQ